MSIEFNSDVTNNIGVTLTTIYTCPALTTAVTIGLNLCNITASGITFDCTFYDASETTTVSLAEDQVLGSNESIVLAGGVQKIVLNAGDYYQVSSSAATSIDTVVSVLEIT